MEAWARELLDVWAPQVMEIVEASMPSVDRMWVGKYTSEDVAQMVRACVAMVGEELEGSTSDLRESYFEMLIPGLAAQGETVSAMAAIDMAIVIRITIAVIPKLAPEHQVKAAEFFVDWQMRFVRDVVVTAINAGAKP